MLNEATLTSVGLDLSHEEVWALMRILNLPGLPGWKPPQLSETPSEFEIAVLRTAENSLAARGLLYRTVEDPHDKLRYGVDRTAAALVGAGVLAERVLRLVHQTAPEMIETRHIYFAESLTVLHMQPEVGSQRFLALNGGEMVLSALASALDLRLDSADRPGDQTVHLTVEQLQTIRQLMDNGDSKACHASLVDMGIDESVSDSLVQAFDTEVNDRVVVVDAVNDRVEAMVVFHVDAGYWLVQEKEDHVSLVPANSSDVTGGILDLLD